MHMASPYSYDYGQNDLAFVGESSAMKRELSSQSVGSNHLDYEPLSSSATGMSGIPNQQVNWHQNTAAGSDIVSCARSLMKPRLSLTPAIVYDVEDYVRRTAEQNPLSFDCTNNILDQPPFNAIASPISPSTSWLGTVDAVPLSRTTSMTSYSSGFSFSTAGDMARMPSSSSHSTGIGDYGDGLGNVSPTNNTSNSPQQLNHTAPLQSGQPNYQPFLDDAPENHAHRPSVSSQRSVSSQYTLLSPLDYEMRRSLSSQSHVSNLSDPPQFQKTSPRRRSIKSQQQSSRSLAPKATETIESTGANMLRIRSSDGTSRDVGVIPRHKRPVELSSEPSQKLICQHCTRVPEGFRGEHELQRHTNLYHVKLRKAWICVNRGPDKQFLSNCKACVEKKKYGAYYNAAAHLRRVHFDPRPRGRKAKNSGEKRGGKAGGNWPPMETLKKLWLEEIEISNEDSSFENDDADEEEEEGQVEGQVERQVLVLSYGQDKLAPPAVDIISTDPASQHFGSFMSAETLDSAYSNATPMSWQSPLGEGLWPAQQAELLRQMSQPFDGPEMQVGSFAVEDEHLSTPSNYDSFLQ